MGRCLRKIKENHGHKLAIIAAIAVFVAILFAGIWWLTNDPRVNLLLNEGGAEWVRFPEPFRLRIHGAEDNKTNFKHIFEVSVVSEKVVLNFYAFKKAELFLDGRPIFRTPDDPVRWKETFHVNLTPLLKQGPHELRIDVANANGHPALLAYSEPLNIFTNSGWLASKDARKWFPAISVDQISPLHISRSFPRADRCLASLSFLFLSILLLFFFLTLRASATRKFPGGEKIVISPRMTGWLVIGAWLIMGENNFWKLPLEMGMDFKGHLQYVQYILENGRIPLATDNWQTFQQPLYYLLSAYFHRLFLESFNTETTIRVLKLLPFFCGILQVEITYQTLKSVYPKNEYLQKTGILIGGFLPMSLYMSQSLGNEPLAGCLTSLIILLAVRISSGSSANREKAIIIGFVLGLALLTKVSAVLIVPPLFFYLLSAIMERKESPAEKMRAATTFITVLLIVSAIVSGWYYARNFIEIGRLYVGGWDDTVRIAWWQDPGYRTLRQIFSFGYSLFYPVYSSLYGFWDAIYSTLWADGFLGAYNRPPWNYKFMMAGLYLSLFPTFAILGGFFAAIGAKSGALRRTLLFAAGSVALYMAAIFYMFMTVPILSSAKATYMLGITPCFALLAAAGIERFASRKYMRAATNGLLACWVVSSYLSYLASVYSWMDSA